MEFIKKNYEKVVLAIVLLGLTVAVALLPVLIATKRDALKQVRITTTNTKPKPLPELNMTTLNTAMQRAEKAFRLDFTTKHNLLNPVLWQLMPDGKLVKVETGKEIGAGALEVTGITPLYLTVSYEGPDPSGYLVNITQATARRPSDREKHTVVALDRKNDLLALKKVGGTPDRPELDLELKTGEAFIIGPDKPYRKVDGYTADLKYPPDASTPAMNAKRVGDSIRFAGGDYLIVEINTNGVRVKDKSNDKTTLVPYKSSN